MATIWEVFGVPIGAALFGTIIAVFAALDRWSSKQVKQDFAAYLKTTDFPALSQKLPFIIQEIFNRIFGKRHFSLHTLIASVLITFLGIIFLMSAGFLLGFLEPRLTPKENVRYWSSYFTDFASIKSFLHWVAWSLVIDYIMLFKTRLMIKLLSRYERIIFAIAVLALDIFAGLFLYIIGVGIVFLLGSGGKFPEARSVVADTFLKLGLVIFNVIFVAKSTSDVFSNLWLLFTMIFGPLTRVSSILFYAGLLPSIWLWIYVLSAFVMKLVLRSARVIRFVTYFLDVDEHPIQSVGVVAAALLTAGYLISSVVSAT
jgi:hypothetical protein